MTDFEVKIDELIGTADSFDKIRNDLQKISSQANGVIRSTRATVISKISAALSRSVICTNINNCAIDMANLSSCLKNVAKIYEKYEENIKDKTTTNPNELSDLIDNVVNTLSKLFPVITGSSTMPLINILHGVIPTGKNSSKSLLESIFGGGEFSSNYKNDFWKKKQNELKKWYEKNKDVKKSEKIATILEYKKEWSAEKTYYRLKGEGKSKYAQGSYDVKVASAETHAEGHIGMYVYEKDANGNTVKKLAPSLGFDVGASATLATASGGGKIGLGKDNNMLGVLADGEVTVGSVDVGLKGNVSLFSDSPEAYVSANAEAVAAEAKGSVGVSLLGTEAKLTGGVKVGIGAHADVGYVDGKLKVDIGASIGLGADVGFEIDIGGTVDAVKSKIKSLWNW